MAAVTAFRPNPAIRVFPNHPCRRGKPRKVALAAAMRKPLLILNEIPVSPAAAGTRFGGRGLTLNSAACYSAPHDSRSWVVKSERVVAH